jgi:hypothetical protein
MEPWRTLIIKETILHLDKYYGECKYLNQMDARLMEIEVAQTMA